MRLFRTFNTIRKIPNVETHCSGLYTRFIARGHLNKLIFAVLPRAKQKPNSFVDFHPLDALVSSSLSLSFYYISFQMIMLTTSHTLTNLDSHLVLLKRRKKSCETVEWHNRERFNYSQQMVTEPCSIKGS
jgi:hypothetical protein